MDTQRVMPTGFVHPVGGTGRASEFAQGNSKFKFYAPYTIFSMWSLEEQRCPNHTAQGLFPQVVSHICEGY